MDYGDKNLKCFLPMRKIIKLFVISIVLSAAITGCNKYLNEPLPAGVISEENAYISDNSVSAVVTGNFLNLSGGGLFGGSSSANLAYVTGLYMDELKNLGSSSNTTNIAFYTDAIQFSNTLHWTDLYTKVFKVNSTLEGINSTGAALYYKNQWLGESYFIRAFLYFYLTNLYGDVPLALTSDYATNNTLSRAPQSQVYQQIIADLRQAQGLLNSGYTDGYGASTSHRVRPNRYAASALLAKTYLYTQKWDSAEVQADSVIGNSTYLLTAINQVFGAGSSETIWSLALPSSSSQGYQYGFYNNGMPSPIQSPNSPTTYNVLVCMDTALINAFEPGDNRRTTWVRTVPVFGANPAITYYFPNKYTASAASSENEIILRLAEIYLIRAEARAHLNNISGAQADLNTVRTRAGLPNTTATDAAGLLNAISRERRVELFTENANRFFDLKRTGTIDSVMTAFAPQKGGSWSHYMQLFPIPTNDLIQDPSLTANPEYQQ